MKKYFFICIIIFCWSQLQFAQLESVSFYTDYSLAPDTRLEITDADAVGGGVKIKFKIIDNFSLSLIGGYKLYSLSEPDVLNNWGWNFWTDRYYNKIVSDLNADRNLAVDISAVQKMDLVPVSLSLSYDDLIFDKFIITPSIGGGICFFTRRMFAIENWSKYFPAADYTFNYSFRNFAPSKKGNPFYLTGDLNLEYKIFEKLGLFSNFRYTFIIPSEGSFGYDIFPIENEFSAAIGLTISY